MAKRLREKIEVMQAAELGQTIEEQRFYANSGFVGDWQSGLKPLWNWAQYNYRVKPGPEEIWFNVYEEGGRGNEYSSRTLADQCDHHTRIAVVRFVEAERIPIVQPAQPSPAEDTPATYVE